MMFITRGLRRSQSSCADYRAERRCPATPWTNLSSHKHQTQYCRHSLMTCQPLMTVARHPGHSRQKARVNSVQQATWLHAWHVTWCNQPGVRGNPRAQPLVVWLVVQSGGTSLSLVGMSFSWVPSAAPFHRPSTPTAPGEGQPPVSTGWQPGV